MNRNLFKSVLYITITLYLLIGGTVAYAQFNHKNDKNIETIKEDFHTHVKHVLHEQLDLQKSSFDLVQFKHGDISWLPTLAKEAGWPRKTWDRLGDIILRESGGCPNRIGGSIVDKNCNIVGHTGATNKSDSGLLQINGVNWDPNRDGRQLLCADYDICTQEQLLDPLTNLTAGYILYQKAGWDPWDPCAWGPKFAHRCKSGK